MTEKVEGAKYVLIKDSMGLKKGDVVTLTHDDGTTAPEFTTADGELFYALMSQVIKLNEQVEKAEPLHISAEQFEQLKPGDKFKLRKDLKVGGYGACMAVTKMQKLAQEGAVITAGEKYDAAIIKGRAKGDYRYYTAEMIAEVLPAEPAPEFDCPELEACKVYYRPETELADAAIFRYKGMKRHSVKFAKVYTRLYTPEGLLVTHTDVELTEWREATAEEVAKLEAAEKEHGYVPPLVNKLGTVIEAGKVYVSDGSYGEKRIFKVSSVGKTSFQKESNFTLPTGEIYNYRLETHIDSQSGSTTVPATAEQIAVFEAAVAKDKAEKAFESAMKSLAA